MVVERIAWVDAALCHVYSRLSLVLVTIKRRVEPERTLNKYRLGSCAASGACNCSPPLRQLLAVPQRMVKVFVQCHPLQVATRLREESRKLRHNEVRSTRRGKSRGSEKSFTVTLVRRVSLIMENYTQGPHAGTKKLPDVYYERPLNSQPSDALPFVPSKSKEGREDRLRTSSR